MEQIIYIAPNGDDTIGDGTCQRPYSTIGKGVEQSRSKSDTCTLQLESGEYYIANPVMLTGEDSGLTIVGSSGTVITGAKPLGKLNWVAQSDGIWRTTLETEPFDRLFADGKEQVLCRYPNIQLGVVPLDGSATPAEIKRRSAGYSNPKGGFIRAIHRAEWGGNSYVIEGKDSTSSCGLKLRWVGDNNRGSGYGNAMVVENIREELDSPGEWFYDTQDKTLYWYAPENIQPKHTMISVSTTRELICLKGTEESPVSDITIEQVTFKHTSRTLFPIGEESKPYVPLLRGDWCVVRSGAVYMEKAVRCAVTNCTFTKLGGNGMFCSGYQEGHIVRGNTFAQLGASAIQIAGEPSAVRQPSFWEHELYPDLKAHQTDVEDPTLAGPCGNDYARNILIEQNHISGVGLLEKQSAGINLSIATGVKILHNTIHDSARSLINVNDGTFGGHEIGWNDLYGAQRETADHGPFNSWGRDRFWSVPHYNASGKWGDKLRRYAHNGEFYDITKLDAQHTNRIHHNRFYHDPLGTHSWGIDLDDGSTNYEIDHNLVLGIGIKLREGFDRVVHDNLLVDGQIHIHVPYTGCNDKIYNNLVCNCRPVATAGCNGRRFRKSGIKFLDNFAFASGEKIHTPSFVQKFTVLKGAHCKDGTLVLPNQWQELFQADYGKKDCDCRSPEYLPTFGAEERTETFWFMGAKCCYVTQAIRSSTALADQEGFYVKKVLPLSKASSFGLRARDVIRSCDGVAVSDYLGKRPKNIAVWRENALVELNIKN